MNLSSRTFTPSVRKSVGRIYANSCALCGAEVSGSDAHIDHVESFANGGKTEHGNAQYLCALCNLRKSSANGSHAAFSVSKPQLKVTLRPWQRECLDAQLSAIASGESEFFVAAGVGSGKTAQAIALYLEGDFDMMIVITTKSGIRGSWSKDAKKMGVNLRSLVTASDFRGDDGSRVIPNGYLLNVQMVGSVANDLMILCARFKVLLVLDEAHHYGEEIQWTSAIDNTFGNAAFSLALSGTPYRGDGQRIRLLSYVKEGRKAVSCPDYVRSYEDALASGEVAPIVTRFVGGSVTKKDTSGRVEVYDYADADYSQITGAPSRELMSTRLRLSAVESLDWQMAAISEARKDLFEFRQGGTPWAGLISCATIAQAKEIAERIQSRWGDKCLLIVQEAKTEVSVEEFINDESYLWAISIQKISEGVSINRLRVGVLLSTTTTRGNFEQIRGRLVRLLDGYSQISQAAVFYIPADPRLIDYAIDSNRMVLHSVPWLNPSELADPGEVESVYLEMIAQASVDLDGEIIGRGETTSQDIAALRERLESVRPDNIINTGDYVLFANPAMDGASIGAEFIDESSFEQLRLELSQVIQPLTAMRIDGGELEVLKSIFSKVA